MNTILRPIGLIICLLAINIASSQNLSFPELTFDFGTIDEDGGVVEHTFAFKNVGTDPVVILMANSSCGCTIADYTREPIVAGGESTISVDFDPMGQPGTITKSIEIITAPENRRYILSIKAKVTPRKRTMEEIYPIDMGGGLRISVNFVPLSLIGQGERRESVVSYINTSKRRIQVAFVANRKSGVADIPSKFTIEAGGSGSFAVAYDLDRWAGRYGVLSDNYSVEVDGKRSKFNFMMKGNAIDNFSEGDVSSPPISNRSSNIVKLGEIKRGRVSGKGGVTLENLGISDLVIRDIYLEDGLRSSIKSGAVIKADQSLEIDVWAETKGFEYGNFSRQMTLTVNDPDNPVQQIRVTGIVVGE